MSNLRTAAQQALEALELVLSSHGVLLLTDPPQDPWKTRGVEGKSRDAITALKSALHQPTTSGWNTFSDQELADLTNFEGMPTNKVMLMINFIKTVETKLRNKNESPA